MRTRRFATLSLALALAVPALASCANGGPASPTPSDVPSSSAAAPLTISGTVSAGVEPHCLVLEGASGSYVLVFNDASLKASAPAGSKVTLVGTPEPRMMTTCQQGVAFVVTSVRKG